MLFITLAVMACVFYYSFYYVAKSYVAENEILVTDKFSGALAKDMGNASDWTIRARRAELDLKRSVPAREIVEGAASAISMKLAENDTAAMVNNINADLRVTYYKEGNFIGLSYQAGNARLAAAVLSLFIKRMVESCVALQVGDLNNEVSTLSELKARLSSDVAASERKSTDRGP